LIYTNKIENILVVVFPLLILFSYLGRGLYNSFLFLTLIASLYLIFKSSSFKHLISDFIKYFIVFTALTIPSFIYAVDPIFSLSKFVSFFLTSISVIISATYLFKISLNARDNLVIALGVLFYSSISMEIITIIGMMFHFDPIVFVKTGNLIPMAGNYHLKEIFTAAILPLGLFYYYVKPMKIKLIFLILAFIGILASTSRTAMIAVLFSVPLFIIIKNRGKIFTKELLMFILILVLALSSSFMLNKKIQQRVESLVTTFSSSTGLSGRYIVYSDAFRYFKEAPIVGNGIKSGVILSLSKSKSNSSAKVKHPHNIWLELLMDVGIVGFGGFIMFIGSLLVYFYNLKDKISNIHNATIWATLLAIFLSSLASWSIWTGNHIGPILIIISIVYYLYKIDINNNIKVSK
jgi:O-antigen ligase